MNSKSNLDRYKYEAAGEAKLVEMKWFHGGINSWTNKTMILKLLWPRTGLIYDESMIGLVALKTLVFFIFKNLERQHNSDINSIKYRPSCFYLLSIQWAVASQNLMKSYLGTMKTNSNRRTSIKVRKVLSKNWWRWRVLIISNQII